MITEIVQVINTEAAARSFACPAFSLNSGELISTFVSIAVFISSAEITDPIHKRRTHHSRGEILKNDDRIITTQAATTWKRILN